MLVVAADEGVMPQTREHVAVCELLGLSAGGRRRDQGRRGGPGARAARGGGGARAARRPRGSADVVHVLGADGRGARRRARGAAACARGLAGTAGRARARAARRRSRLHGARRGDGGDRDARVRAASPSGDSLFVVGERATTRDDRARALHVHDTAVERVEAPTRLAMNLAGIAARRRAARRRRDRATRTCATTTLVDVLAARRARR